MENKKIIESLRNMARFVEITDKATNTTTTARRMVKLKASDFGDKAVSSLYKSRILDVANAVNAFLRKDSDDKGAEFKLVSATLQGVFDFFRVNCGAPAYKVRNSEVRYILETATRHKFAKTVDGNPATLDRVREGKSLEGIRGDVEEMLYYRLNNKALPSFISANSVTTANAKAAETLRKENEQRAAAAEKAADVAAAQRAKNRREKPAIAAKAETAATPAA